MLIDVNGTRLEIGDAILQDNDWVMLVVSGSTGSARVRGRNGSVKKVSHNTLEDPEYSALSIIISDGTMDSYVAVN